MNTPRYMSQALCAAFALFSLSDRSLSVTPVENPVSKFTLTTPGDPPSGPAPVTSMTNLNGSYTDSDYLGGNVDMTMDESGKVIAMGSVDGYHDKDEGNTLTRTASVKTVNGVPTLIGSASTSGTYYSTGGITIAAATGPQALSGSGKVSIPLGPPETPENGLLPVTVTDSHTGKLAKDGDSDKATTETVFLETAQVKNIVDKGWSMKVIIAEKTDAKGKKYVVASLDLKKPDGSRTFFKEKTVRFSATNGYSFVLSGGLAVNPNIVVPTPLKDQKTGKDLIDKKSQIRFSKLMFKKNFGPGPAFLPSWEPAAGGVNYKFLGQKGFGNVFNFDITLN